MNEILHHPVTLAIFAGVVAWLATSAGAALIFATHRLRDSVQDMLIGAATGIMLAVTYELVTSARESAGGSLPPAIIGFLAGTAFLYVLDRLLPHLHPGLAQEDAEGLPTRMAGSVLMVLAITIHNIPEGLAIGVSFGAYGVDQDPTQWTFAVFTTTGIAIQDVIEGLLVAIPLTRMGISIPRAFFWGQASGFVEMVGAAIGSALVLHTESLLSYSLAFAGGAMFYVIFDELIPEIRRTPHNHMAIFGTVAGLCAMFFLQALLS